MPIWIRITAWTISSKKKRIENIAIAMSNAWTDIIGSHFLPILIIHSLRTGNTTSPSSVIRSSDYTSEEYIAVESKCLAAPVCIWLAITPSLFATKIESRKADLPLWKSSSLVLLHCAERDNGRQTIKQMEKESDKTKVQLHYTGQSSHLYDVTDRLT
jgi:hypothetical protein